MKHLITILLLQLSLYSCFGQTKAKTIYNEDFKWTITIPENFINVSPQDWEKVQDRGIEAIEETFGEQVINQAKTIFVYKNADFNMIESNYQPFDVEVDGNYIESCQGVNEIIYDTFKAQMPNIKIDSISSVEKISNLDFQAFKVKINFPNGIVMHSILYSRLFTNREFSVNITYIDPEEGKKMIEAWTESKFE